MTRVHRSEGTPTPRDRNEPSTVKKKNHSSEKKDQISGVFNKKVPVKKEVDRTIRAKPIKDSGDFKAKLKSSSKTKIPPQVYIGLDNNNAPKISIGRKAPPIKNLILEGGGVKGIVYPTFLREVDKRVGLIKDLDEVAGSSAGACMAFLIAAGVSPHEIEEFTKNNEVISELWGSKRGKVTRDIKLGCGILPAIKMRETLVKLTAKPANDYYQKHVKNSPDTIKLIMEKEGGKAFLEKAQNGFSMGLTFNDLKILHELNPEQFKLLHVTAYDQDRLKPVYFNAEKAKDVNCFEAVVASMSIPIIIKQVKLDRQDGKGVRRLVDGGAGTNIPLEIFSKRENYRPEENLVLHFDNKGRGYKNLHSPQYPVEGFFARILDQTARAIVNVAARIFLGVKNFEKTSDRDAQKVHAHGFNAVVIPHGKIDTTDFFLKHDSSKWQKAVKQARIVAERYAELSGRGHLIQNDYKNISEAIFSLKSEELEALNSVAAEKIKLAEEVIKSDKTLASVAKAHYEIEFYETIQSLFSV